MQLGKVRWEENDFWTYQCVHMYVCVYLYIYVYY